MDPIISSGTAPIREGEEVPIRSRLATALLLLVLAQASGTAAAPPRAQPQAVLPDIYYLILDRYAGLDTLETYGFDNRPFLDWLRARGFYVPELSRGNYPKTAHSLAASLDMRYLDFLTRQNPDPADWKPVYELLLNTRVSRFLQDRGYRYVHIGSWWGPTAEDPAADIDPRFEVPEGAGLRERLWWQALFQFAQTERASRLPGPTFVYSHILMPHPPYVFHADGSFVPGAVEEARIREQNYVDQLRFTNTVTAMLLDRILGRPGPRPIVILQSDEGPHPLGYEMDPLFDWTRATTAELKEKLVILNSYYLPGEGLPRPYPTITPVNTFRIVLNRYFGQDLPLIRDQSYVFRDEHHLYDFSRVTERIR